MTQEEAKQLNLKIYTEGKARADRLNSAAEPLIARAVNLYRAVGDACLSGSLISGYRLPSGDIQQIPWQWWNAEPDIWTARLLGCQINPSAPFAFPMQVGAWLYLHAGTVESFVEGAKTRVRPPWWPKPDRQNLIDWCNDPEAEAGVVAELGRVPLPPTEPNICRRMTSIWRAAGGTCSDRTVKEHRGNRRRELRDSGADLSPDSNHPARTRQRGGK